MLYKRELLKVLRERVLEKRRFIQVLAGPRQVGKTTIISQLIEENLIFARSYSVDAIAGSDISWIDTVWEGIRSEMNKNGINDGLLIIDEIQKIANWSEYVKKNWDEDTKNKVNLKLIVSGSSRLLLQQGLSESLMGRYELNYLGHWTYQEMHDVFGFSPEQFVWFGGYPGAADLIEDELRYKSYVQNAIIDASINKDVLSLTRIHKPALLNNLFELGAAYSSQILSYTKILGQLQEPGNTSTLASYTKLLDQAGLISGLDTFSSKLIKTKASSPKFQVHNTALISAGQQREYEAALADPEFWGRMVESAIGAHLLGITTKDKRFKLFYWRIGNHEVDFVLKGSDTLIGIEVKSKIAKREPTGIQKFKENFPDASTILISQDGLDYRQFLTMDVTDIIKCCH